MAAVWLVVLTLFSSQEIFASYRDCSNIGNIRNCDECIRCAGHWCNDPNESRRCTIERFDDWCPGQQETLTYQQEVTEAGQHFKPKFMLRNIRSGADDSVTIDFKSSSKNPKIDVVFNTTQRNLSPETSVKCENGVCRTTIEILTDTDFCEAKGHTSEFFNIKLKVDNISEEAVMKFHVPCACGCSEKVELRSPRCNGRGDYTCGVCTCDKDWTGTFCESPICHKKRGDVPCTDSTRSDVECSGNGVCSACDECVCFTDRVGSQYFDKDNYCADICTITNDCDDCFKNPMPGRCDLCHFPLIHKPYNQSLIQEKDDFNRNVWVTCNDTLDGCFFEYVAMKDANDDTYYMVTKSCNPVEEKQVVGGGVNLTLPIVLCAIGAVLALAAAGGYLMYRSRPPALPLADPLYQNIGAEDCTGENPLYKPPTSSFKNPTYGKW
ncbi:integrin beta-6-like [Colias croceus]|uniref:integrin beta-6-like n=1 Tax=Colias crocea TaxID=72248 RepID=UPI001E27A07F|nr:integrin beta-6-like [Colias croceus]